MGTSLNPPRDRIKITAKLLTAPVILIIVTLLLFVSAYTIDEGQRGVILRNGALSGEAGPGMHFKIPLIDAVEKISTRTKSRTYNKVLAYSRDQQPASLELSVTYRLPVDKVADIYTQFGGETGLVNRVLDRRVLDEVKNVFGQFNAVTAIQERARLVTDMTDALRAAVDAPITILSLQLENIDFSDIYEQSIEQRMLVEVEVQKVRQNAVREEETAKITVTKAKADAEAQLALARATAESARLLGEAEASAIRAKGSALRDNPALVALISAERWDGKLPQTMVPGGALPFVNIK